MILVFGGTTEGRKAVEVLEEAGRPYYYSTRGDEQQVELLHGVHLTGSMEVAEMTAFCRQHDIRLMVDAAHPFAEALHRNLLLVAGLVGLPVIRYDRIYPPRDPDIVWCRDYDECVELLSAHHVERLLALTGVNTITKLREYWTNHDTCWFRILRRCTSLAIAQSSGFPADRLVFYDSDDTSSLMRALQPDAIVTKESGLSGGFVEKVKAARQAGIKVFVVQRPDYPPAVPDQQQVRMERVDGPHGLRRAIEHLLPEFYPLHSGLTTGTCATAAAIAAVLQYLKQEMPATVPVELPNGETIPVGVTYGNGYASCVKEAGDDPDVTDGIEIRVYVQRSDHFDIDGGEGVGIITLPGFDYPPGSPAINKTPRQMLTRNLTKVCDALSVSIEQLRVVISVPRGAEMARRTFNPRLGIEGGISIIGVSGIVRPFSEEAFIDSIRKCMTIARASGTERVVINSGAKSERFLKALYPELPGQAFVQYGNYIGETLRIASELSIPHVTLGVMLGKAVKLAQGHLDTHSRKATMDLDFIGTLLKEAGVDVDLSHLTLARELWQRIQQSEKTDEASEPVARLHNFARVVIRHCADYCRPLLPQGELTLLLIDDDGNIFGEEAIPPRHRAADGTGSLR